MKNIAIKQKLILGGGLSILFCLILILLYKSTSSSAQTALGGVILIFFIIILYHLNRQINKNLTQIERHNNLTKQISSDFDIKYTEFEDRTQIIAQGNNDLKESIFKLENQLDKHNDNLNKLATELQNAVEATGDTDTKIQTVCDNVDRNSKQIAELLAEFSRIEKFHSDTDNLISQIEKSITADKETIINDFKKTVSANTNVLQEIIKKDTKQLSGEIDMNFFQTEALFSIFATINPTIPLPTTTGWAATANLLKQVITDISTLKPEIVVEAGSGLSSVVIGYVLKELGKGKLYSLEHEEHFHAETCKLIEDHGLTEFVEIVYAPLKEYTFEEGSWKWYDDAILGRLEEGSIGYLLVDGPPGLLQPLSRYPALPILKDYVKKDAIIILDDANRNEEKKIVERWNRDSQYAVKTMSSVKDYFVLEPLN